MARLTFYMTPAYGRNIDRILQTANRDRPKGQGFKDISEWERFIIKTYLTNWVQVYRKWEIEGEVFDVRTLKTYPLLEDGRGRSLSLNMSPSKTRTFKRVLTLSEPQTEWLKKVVLFLSAADGAARKEEKGMWKGQPLRPYYESEASSVGEFVGRMLSDAYASMASVQDLKEIG